MSHHNATDVTKSAQCRFIMLPTYQYQRNVVLTCYWHRYVNTAPVQHATNVTTLANDVSWHQRRNVCTASYQHATDVTMPGKRRINMHATSQCQHNVVITCYDFSMSVQRRINLLPTSQRHHNVVSTCHLLHTILMSYQCSKNVISTSDLSVSTSHRFPLYSAWYV